MVPHFHDMAYGSAKYFKELEHVWVWKVHGKYTFCYNYSKPLFLGIYGAVEGMWRWNGSRDPVEQFNGVIISYRPDISASTGLPQCFHWPKIALVFHCPVPLYVQEVSVYHPPLLQTSTGWHLKNSQGLNLKIYVLYIQYKTHQYLVSFSLWRVWVKVCNKLWFYFKIKDPPFDQFYIWLDWQVWRNMCNLEHLSFPLLLVLAPNQR